MVDRDDGRHRGDDAAPPIEPAPHDPLDRESLQLRQLVLQNQKLEREIIDLKSSRIRSTATIVTVAITAFGVLLNWHGQTQEAAKQRQAQRAETTRIAEEKYAQSTGQLSSPSRVLRVQAVTYLAHDHDPSTEVGGRSLTALCQQLEAEPDPAVLEQVIWSIRQFAPDLGERSPDKWPWGSARRDWEHKLRLYDLVMRNVANTNRRSAALFARDAGRWIGSRILERPGDESASLTKLQSRTGQVDSASLDSALARRVRRELEVLAAHVKRVPMLYEQNALAGLAVSFDIRDMFQAAGIQNRCRDEIVDLVFRRSLGYRGYEGATDSLLVAVDAAGMHLAATSFCLRRLLIARGSSRERNDLQGVVLVPVNLQGANLAGIDFSRAYIGAALKGANLDSCELGSAIVYGRLDSSTSMRNANLAMTLFPDSLRTCRSGVIPAVRGANWKEACVGRIVPFEPARVFDAPDWADCAPPQ